MPYDPLLAVFGDDPEALKEFERIKALRGDVSAAKRLQKLGAVGAIASDEGLRGIGDNLYRTGAAQEDRYKEALAQGYEGLKQTRSRAKERADEQAWREQQRADEQAYRAQTLALQRQQEARLRDAAEQGKWIVQADPVRGGFIRINTRTGEALPVDVGGMGSAGGAQAPARKPGSFEMPAGIKLTETEEKSRFFAQNMAEALPKLTAAVQGGYSPSRMDQFAAGPPASGIGGMVQQNIPRSMASDVGREFYTNGRQVLAAILRKESGAAITDDEWQNYGPMYLPWPGDSPEQIQTKIQNLYGITENMATGAGSARNYWTPLEQPNWSGPRQMNAPGGQAAPAGGGRAQSYLDRVGGQ
jgi:hypothetical protein